MRSATTTGLLLLAALLASGCGGHGATSDPTLTISPKENSYLQRVSDLGNEGSGGGVPNLQADEVIAAGRLYCQVKGEHQREHWTVGDSAARQAVTGKYGLNFLQLEAVTEAALQIFCPET